MSLLPAAPIGRRDAFLPLGSRGGRIVQAKNLKLILSQTSVSPNRFGTYAGRVSVGPISKWDFFRPSGSSFRPENIPVASFSVPIKIRTFPDTASGSSS